MIKKKILISTGECSGDFYGAALARELKILNPSLEIIGLGSKAMRNAGVEILYDTTEWSAIGLFESLRRVPKLLWYFGRLKVYIKNCRPDLLVLIDFPGFNMRLGKFARKINISSVYYFPPSAWANTFSRPREVSGIVDKVIATFSYTRDIYNKAGLDVVFLGHPMVEYIRPRFSREEFLKFYNLSKDKLLISFFPGSRSHEIKYIFPVMLEACKIIQKILPDAQFVVSSVSEYMEPLIKYYLRKHNLSIPVITGNSHELMNSSSFLILTSGTATLEAACLGIPMIIVYKISSFSYFIARKTLNLPLYAGLPNLVIQRKIVPELLQENLTASNLGNLCSDIILNTSVMEQMKTDLKEVYSKLGTSDSGKKIAKEIFSMIGKD